jgi:hypothetical protein
MLQFRFSDCGGIHLEPGAAQRASDSVHAVPICGYGVPYAEALALLHRLAIARLEGDQ